MPSKFKKAIGAVKDQTSISFAKVASNNSSNLDVAVLKATTHDDIPIDERYVQEVVQLVSSDKAYAAACAKAIGKRIGRTRNWIVALKSLMLVLRIFQDGDPYFPREVLHAMKRGAKILNLSSFRDDSHSSPWDYTAFVRTFALYLDERLDCFLTGKLQRRTTHKEREKNGQRGGRRANEPIRDMKPAMLLDRIAFWQQLLDRAIATKPTGSAKGNRLVQASLYAVVVESFDLYKDISDGLTLLLDSFFHLQYNSCVNAFQTTCKASKQFEELGEFYSFCKTIGVGKTSEYPSVQKISEELIETLQEFLKDQSSFPSITKSPRRLALPAPPDARSARHESYDSYGGLSEFSELTTTNYSTATGASEFSSTGTSDFSSRCTLEDLISASETGRTHGISIDLEEYRDQFEKKSQQDETFRVSDAVSTHSLPTSTSIVDLVSLDDWPDQEIETEHEQKSKQEQHNPATSWELVLAETMQQPSAQQESDSLNTFDAFQEQDKPKQEQQAQQNPATSWEFVFAETTQQPSTQQEANSSNTFNSFPEQEQPNQPQPNSATSWELVLAGTLQQPSTQQEPNLLNTFNAFPEQEHQQKGMEASHGQGWELALAETMQQSDPNLSNRFNALTEQELKGEEASSSNGWELVLAETATQPTEQTFNLPYSMDSFYSQPAGVSSPVHYNPFLDESKDLAIVPTTASTSSGGYDAFFSDTGVYSSAPTFRATPTFSAQNPDSTTPAMQDTNDPFGTIPNEQMYNSSMNPHNLLYEQQLWLQQQHKIIAKHMA